MLYRVGGWVRDKLLGYDPKDNDYVVVGETPTEFEARWPGAYKVQAIGKSFPVYLVESKTDGFKGEYAFARRERKIGLGHNGFEVTSDIGVTLEEDLFRRDLTCNAIAVRNNDIAFNM